MAGTDSDIDLSTIDRAIYQDDIETHNIGQGKEKKDNTNRCINKDDVALLKSSSQNFDDFDYRKYFDISNISLTGGTLRSEFAARSKDKWILEKDFLINSMKASLVFKHKDSINISRSENDLSNCKAILENVDGCFYVYPYIEKVPEKIAEYEIYFPREILFAMEDQIITFKSQDIPDATPMLEKPDIPDPDLDIIDRITIDLNADYENIEDTIGHNDIIKNLDFTDKISFIDCINNIIDYDIYREFRNILLKKQQVEYNTFANNIYLDGDVNLPTGYEQLNKDSESLITTKMKPLHIIPKRGYIDSLRKDIEEFVQNKINKSYENIPKINRTNTRFICKKMIINSIYFTDKSYLKNDDPNPIRDYLEDREKIHTIVNETDDLYITKNIENLIEEEKLAKRYRSVTDAVAAKQGDVIYHFFVIQVNFPICNSDEIRTTISDALINNNIFFVILIHLIIILLHGAISCCIEFWLNYGEGTECIYIINSCKNIANGDNKISLIDNLFKWRLSNFPYKYCKNKNQLGGGSEIIYNKKKLYFPASDKNVICLKEDHITIYENKRPFPYNIIDYGEKNFNNESIKIFFRFIVTTILIFLLPFRYCFNIFLNKSSNMYKKYIGRNELLSSIVFVFLPFFLTISALLLFISLFVSFILLFIYIIISILHNTLHIITPLFSKDCNSKYSFSLQGFSLLGIICLLVSIFSIYILLYPCTRTQDNSGGFVCYIDDKTELGTITQKLSLFIGSILGLILSFAVKSYLLEFNCDKIDENKNKQDLPNKMDVLVDEKEYSEKFNWIYKLLFNLFEYNELTNDQQLELKNYRIDHTVIRNREIQPLKEFLSTDNIKFSIRYIIKIVLILMIVILIIAGQNFSGKGKDGLPRILSFAVIFSIFSFSYIFITLKKNIITYLNNFDFNNYDYSNLYYEEPTYRNFFLYSFYIFFDYYAEVFFTLVLGIAWGLEQYKELELGTYILWCGLAFIGLLILFGAAAFLIKINGKAQKKNEIFRRRYFEPFFKDISDIKKIFNSQNSNEICYDKILDLSEVILLLKKTIYIFCSFIVGSITFFVLPIVLLLTLIFMCLNLLYIYFIVPFVKGGHFFFRTMKNRYKILTYMLCTAVILAINRQQLFGSNTNVVVYTMSGILGILIIYNIFKS